MEKLTTGANRIDFVMDTYMNGSIKDSERQRRSDVTPIEIRKRAILSHFTEIRTSFVNRGGGGNKVKITFLTVRISVSALFSFLKHQNISNINKVVAFFDDKVL